MMPGIEVRQIDLARGIAPITLREGTTMLRLRVRIHERQLGELVLRADEQGVVDAEAISAGILMRLLPALLRAGIIGWLELPPERRRASPWGENPTAAIRSGLDAILATGWECPRDTELPSITVAVCTRDRAPDLARCLEAISRLDYPNFDVVVVDNAPSTDATRELVTRQFPNVRYVLEPRPGLDWARNRAILSATGEVVAFTDDDVLVDPWWLRAYGRVFAASPELAAATGSVVPAELDTPAQMLFEEHGGFLRGWDSRWYRSPRLDHPETVWHHGAGKFGTGANMAFRRGVFDTVGGFDPALDVGTASNGGGDLEMYFRVLQEGFCLAYVADASANHRHRRDLDGLQYQLGQWGEGMAAYITRCEEHYPGEKKAFRRLRRWWYTQYIPRRVVRSLLGRTAVPARFAVSEARGGLRGARSYRNAVKTANERAAAFPDEPTLRSVPVARPADPRPSHDSRIEVRTVDLAGVIEAITGLSGTLEAHVFATERGTPTASCRPSVEGGTVSLPNLRESIAEALVAQFSPDLMQAARAAASDWVRSRTGAQLDTFAPPVSVVVATADRPHDLRRCVVSLLAQDYAGPVEIVVVDNRPASGLTPQALAEFPDVVLVRESRPGLSYARNAGIVAATGSVLAMTDDDVVAPPDWLTRIVAPFARSEVGLVTGNVLPIELETASQRQFEAIGGLGKGFDRREFDALWFWSQRGAVPTWNIGATANTAVRARALGATGIGLMEEALGAGTSAGVGEDTYMYYRLIRAGWTAVYEPTAWVWHRHRSDEGALGRQISAYSRGHVAYHLTTLLVDGDTRALRRIFLDLPLWDAKSLWRWLRGRSSLPLPHILREIAGHAMGPLAFVQSRLRARRLGRDYPPSRHPADSVSLDTEETERHITPARVAPAVIADGVPPVPGIGTSSPRRERKESE